jgi:hypothetical protein
MPWNVVCFTATQLHGPEGAYVFFKQCFGLHQAAVRKGLNRPEIAVFLALTTDNLGRDYYFSPEASALYTGLLDQFEARECECPDKASLSLLIGSQTKMTDSWQSLFSETAGGSKGQ